MTSALSAAQLRQLADLIAKICDEDNPRFFAVRNPLRLLRDGFWSAAEALETPSVTAAPDLPTPAAETRPHDWVPSTLGHGETMCRLCTITNREAAVLGKLNECDVPPTASARAAGDETACAHSSVQWSKNGTGRCLFCSARFQEIGGKRVEQETTKEAPLCDCEPGTCFPTETATQGFICRAMQARKP